MLSRKPDPYSAALDVLQRALLICMLHDPFLMSIEPTAMCGNRSPFPCHHSDTINIHCTNSTSCNYDRRGIKISYNF